MSLNRIIVIGASSGGIQALTTIAAALPAGLEAPVCVVVHTSPQSPGLLDRILSRAGPLNAVTAEPGIRLSAGTIYVAPPDHHLLVEPGTLTLSKGPKENRFRPAIDPLFRSAAQVYGPAAIGVILTGNLDDGTSGLWVLKQLGGIAIAQDPADALFPSMPRSAIRHVAVDFVVPAREIGQVIQRLMVTPVAASAASAGPMLDVEVQIARGENAVSAGLEHVGELSPFACPECHGVLLRLKGSQPMRFRCHTGHAYSATSLVAAVNEAIEDALWTSVRALEEGGRLMGHIAEHLRAEPSSGEASHYDEQADEAHRQSESVRDVVRLREALRSVEG